MPTIMDLWDNQLNNVRSGLLKSFELKGKPLRVGNSYDLTLEEAFPTCTKKELAKLKEITKPVTMVVTKIDFVHKTVTLEQLK